MQRNIFAQSIYYKVFGTIIELPLLKNNILMPYSYDQSKLAQSSEWIVDYTGKIYKNRYHNVDEIKMFLNSDRNDTLSYSSYNDALVAHNSIVKTILNYQSDLAAKNKVIVNITEVKEEYLVLTDID